MEKAGRMVESVHKSRHTLAPLLRGCVRTVGEKRAPVRGLLGRPEPGARLG